MSFLDTYKTALLEEFGYLNTETPRISLFDGKLEYEEKDGFVYSFTLSKEIGLPDGTPIRIYNGNKVSISGSVVYSDGYEIVIKVPQEFDF